MSRQIKTIHIKKEREREREIERKRERDREEEIKRRSKTVFKKRENKVKNFTKFKCEKATRNFYIGYRDY